MESASAFADIPEEIISIILYDLDPPSALAFGLTSSDAARVFTKFRTPPHPGPHSPGLSAADRTPYPRSRHPPLPDFHNCIIRHYTEPYLDPYLLNSSAFFQAVANSGSVAQLLWAEAVTKSKLDFLQVKFMSISVIARFIVNLRM